MPTVMPFLWYDADLEQALELYASVLPVVVEETSRSGPDPTSPLFSASFSVAGQRFVAINGGPDHPHTDAFSIMVLCEDQGEIDRCWDGLTAGGGEEGRCGWLKDRFGVSWQIVPRRLSELLGDPDPLAAGRARDAMLAMGRLDIAALEAARRGE